jgi:hypothetical protein
MIKKVINIFILLVFATQILPIKQVGSLLFGNQITEDVIQDIDDVAKDGLKGKSDFTEANVSWPTAFAIQHLFTLTELSVIFPHNHSTDIYSPPPNASSYLQMI